MQALDSRPIMYADAQFVASLDYVERLSESFTLALQPRGSDYMWVAKATDKKGMTYVAFNNCPLIALKQVANELKEDDSDGCF